MASSPRPLERPLERPRRSAPAPSRACIRPSRAGRRSARPAAAAQARRLGDRLVVRFLAGQVLLGVRRPTGVGPALVRAMPALDRAVRAERHAAPRPRRWRSRRPCARASRRRRRCARGGTGMRISVRISFGSSAVEEEAREELVDRDRALARSARWRPPRRRGEHRRRMIVGRDRRARGCRPPWRGCAPADRRSPPRCRRAADSWRWTRSERSSADSRVRPPIAQVAALLLDVLEAGDAPDVDQMAGGAQPELEQRQQALAAGEHLGVVAVLSRAAPSPPPAWAARGSRRAEESSGLTPPFYACTNRSAWLANFSRHPAQQK